AEARVGRGAALAELGRPREAAAEVDRGLDRGPRTTDLLYNAARVFARIATSQQEPAIARKHNERSVSLLKEAVEALPGGRRGRFWREQVRRDPAFRHLAQQEEFARLTRHYDSAEEPRQAMR